MVISRVGSFAIIHCMFSQYITDPCRSIIIVFAKRTLETSAVSTLYVMKWRRLYYVVSVTSVVTKIRDQSSLPKEILPHSKQSL